MRALIGTLLLLTHTHAAPAESEVKANCEADFVGEDATCASTPGMPIGSVTKSAAVTIANQVYIVKFDDAGNRGYVEVFKDKPPQVIDPSKCQELDKQYDPKVDTPVTFDCVAERRDCGIPEPADQAQSVKCPPENSSTAAIKEIVAPVEKLGDEVTCTQERQDELAQKTCDGKTALSIAGNCLNNLLTGAFNSLRDTGSFMYGLIVGAVKLPVRGYDWVGGTNYTAKVQAAADMPTQYISDWWAADEQAENKTSDVMDLASHTDAKTLEVAANDAKSEGNKPTPGMLARFADYMMSTVTTNYGCLKWSGIPNGKGSKCLQPWTTWACADCSAKANLLCGTAGFLAGEIGSAVLLGGFFKYLATGAKLVLNGAGKGADALQGLLARSSKFIPAPEKVSIFGKGVAGATAGVTFIGAQIDKANSIAGKFMMDQIRSIGRNLENKVPPPVVGRMAAGTVIAPAAAANWYWNKLESAFASGLGGNAKRLEVVKEQAEGAVDDAKQALEVAQKEAAERGQATNYAVADAKEELAKAERNFEHVRQLADVNDLRNLGHDFADNLVRTEVERAAKAGQSVSHKELERLRAEAVAAGQVEQGKNLLIAYKGIAIVNKAPGATLAELKEQIAPVLHESWQNTRKATHEMIDKWISGEQARLSEMPPAERSMYEKIAADAKNGNYPQYVPRIKPLNAAKVYDKDGAIDIANTTFDKLSPYWKADNQTAGENILSVLLKLKGADGKIVSSGFDKMTANLSESDPNYLRKAGQLYSQTGTAGISDSDPIAVAAAREFNKWKARTGTSYSKNLQLALVFETLEDLSDNEDSAVDFYNEVINKKTGE